MTAQLLATQCRRLPRPANMKEQKRDIQQKRVFSVLSS